MALRYTLPFTSLKRNAALAGEAFVVELWDEDFSGTASEIDGDAVGLNIEWEGQSDFVSPVMASSATYSMLIRGEGDMDIINDLAGAREGRFKMVVRRNGSSNVYWAGWVQADQISYPDQFYPFHLEIFAVDGIARLKDMDYVQTGGAPYDGYATFMGHLLNLIAKIDITDVGTWPTNRIRSTAWWYSDDMDTSKSPLVQMNLDHERFQQKEKNGTTTIWNSYAVLEALMQSINCQFMLANGMFHVRSIDQYKENTQRVFYFNASGTQTSYVAAEDIDAVVDYYYLYPSAEKTKKLNGGRYTFLQPLKKVCVDYKHKSSENKATGMSWAKGDQGWKTIANVFNYAPALTKIKVNVKIKHLTQLGINPPGSAAWPSHRFIWYLGLRFTKVGGGWKYLRRTLVNGQVTQIQTNEVDFGDVADEFPIYSQVVNYNHNNQFITSEFDFTVGDLEQWDIEVDANIQMQIKWLSIERLDGTTLTFGGTYQGNYQWQTADVWVSATDEATGINPDNETLRHCAVNIGDNVAQRYITTHIGDGPNTFSISSYRFSPDGLTSGEATENWSVKKLGPNRILSQLLAERVLQFRKVPQKVFQGSIIYPGLNPWLRLIDQDEAYMATRITLSAFTNVWEGEFIVMDGDVDDITLPEPWTPPIKEPTTPGGYPDPPDPDKTPDPNNSPTTEIMVGVSGWVAQSTNNVTSLTADKVASTNPTLTITPVDYQAFKKGDKVVVLHPGTGQFQELTVTNTYTINSTSLALTGTLGFDLPAGSLVKLAKKTEMQVRGFSHYQRGFTGEFWAIPTTMGTLPNPATVGSDEIRRRVKVFRNGVRLVYDANNYPECFGIKPATNEIEFYYKVRGETVFLEVT